MANRRRRAAGTRRTRRRQASNNHRRHRNHYSGGGGRHSSTGGGGIVGLITGIVDLVQSIKRLKQDWAAYGSAKTALGPAKFGRLKNLTRDFAAGFLEPEMYIDRAAELFDGGIGDPAFRSFVAGVIQHCPNRSSALRASRYLESLRVASKMQEQSAVDYSESRMYGYDGETGAGAPWNGFARDEDTSGSHAQIDADVNGDGVTTLYYAQGSGAIVAFASAGGQQHNEIPVAVAVPMTTAAVGETSPPPSAPPLPAEVPYAHHYVHSAADVLAGDTKC